MTGAGTPQLVSIALEFGYFRKPGIQIQSGYWPSYNHEDLFMTKPTAIGGPQAPRNFWAQHRETSLNWLALGLLLAAWNASDNDAATQARRRPEALRGYSSVSVRAAQRAVSINL